MQSVSDSLKEIYGRIENASKKSGRNADSIKLLAVSKTFPSTSIQEAIDAGQVSFGESKFQEAESKIHELNTHLDWHFIGNLQRNKVRKILPLFSTIHSISSKKLAVYTNNVAGDLGLRPKVFFEVNIGEEESKHGFFKKDLYENFAEFLQLKNVEIQGLMAIPPAGEENQVRAYFAELRDFQSELEEDFGISLPELSMGMSSDFEMAIEEGSTIVRVGSAIFGSRFYKN